MLKISELASQAGVEKSTVQHYIREGLLPSATSKPHKNMAYYSQDLVERIVLIKELQTKRFFPLAQIKKMFDDAQGIHEIKTFINSQPLTLSSATDKELSRIEIIKEGEITEQELSELEDLAYISAKKVGDAVFYSPADVSIIKAVTSMRKAGLNQENGFKAEDISIYKDLMEKSIEQEVQLFISLIDDVPREKILEMARAGLEGTNALIIALRRKLFLSFLEKLES